MPRRKSKTQLVRPLVEKLKSYVPGEQPRIAGLIKLNTNENPYPPSSRVLAAVRQAADSRLRLYPNPTAQPLRERLARFHRCRAANIIIGNGSDELLALATRAFVEPKGSPRSKLQPGRSTVQFFDPSYSLYPVLAEIHGARINRIPLAADFSLPSNRALVRSGRWDPGAALTFVTTPNAPTGRGYRTGDLDAFCRRQRGVVILDEAYVDFAAENAMRLALRHPHVLVARTFSKAFSLCFQRVGYLVGDPQLIAALDKVRDSYNVNGLGQVAALATLDSMSYYRRNLEKVIATRERVAEDLIAIGFEVLPSRANFLLVRPVRYPAKEWLDRLRHERILVRWFDTPELRSWLRISIGTGSEMEEFLRCVRRLVRR